MIVPNLVSIGCPLNGLPLVYGASVSKNLMIAPLAGFTTNALELRSGATLFGSETVSSCPLAALYAVAVTVPTPLSQEIVAVACGVPLGGSASVGLSVASPL